MRHRPAGASACVLRAQGLDSSASPSATGWPAPATRSSSTSTTSTTSTRRASSAASSGPIAKACYWINQNVIDARRQRRRSRGASGRATATTSTSTRSVVDGAVNGAGLGRRGDRRRPAPVQSGKVSMYGALLFGGRRDRRPDPRHRRLGKRQMLYPPTPRNNWLLPRRRVPAARRRRRAAVHPQGGGAAASRSPRWSPPWPRPADRRRHTRLVRLRPGRHAPVLRERAVDRRHPLAASSSAWTA